MANSWKQNKEKNSIGLILILPILAIFLIAVFVYFFKRPIYPKDIGIIINGNDYFLEIAQNNKQRKIGLSKRNEICSNCGMLFVFDKEEKHSFWMKDTYVPLDMIWFNSDNQIVKIITSAAPNSETIYQNENPAKYVIELNANESLKLGLKIGDTIPLDLKPNESSN